MTYIDRDHELRESALSCIYIALESSSVLSLSETFIAELQSGKSAEINGVRKVDNESILLITPAGEIPTMRLESNSLMNLVDERIMTKLFSLK